MFTGLVEKVSKVEKISYTDKGARIYFLCDFDDVEFGSSISVNGACLSISEIDKNLLCADIMKETLNHTNLNNLKKGDEINLERAMRLNQRLDGHIVSGHIDNCATIENITQDGFSKRIKIKAPSDLVIKKGSVAINGVSLTVSDVFDDGFEVSLIPLTIENTNLKNLKKGDIVNIEYDLFAKYIKKFNTKKESKITLEFLKDHGF